MEHILLNWDEIVELLFEELIHEEVQELNQIEFRKNPQAAQKPTKTSLADRSMYGKYHDYKSVDLRDIMSLFEDYSSIEQRMKSKLSLMD